MKKYKEITLMSAFLCLAVIMIHITAVPSTDLTWGSAAHTIMFAVNKALTFAVPGFIFLSGFKLYSKYGGGKMSILEFFRGRLLKIVVPYLISVAVYFVCMFTVGWASFAKLPEYVFLGTLAAHFYYVVIAVQLYLLFPLLKWIFDKLPITVTVISLASTILLNQFVWFTYSDRFFATYLFYFALGMLFARYQFYTKTTLFGIISAVASVAVGVWHFAALYNALATNVMYKWFGIVNVLYVTLSIAALISIFTWISKLGIIYKLARRLDGASYEIYLYHLLAVTFIQSYVTPRLALSISEQFMLSFVVIYGLSFLWAYLKNKLITYKKNKKTAV